MKSKNNINRKGKKGNDCPGIDSHQLMLICRQDPRDKTLIDSILDVQKIKEAEVAGILGHVENCVYCSEQVSEARDALDVRVKQFSEDSAKMHIRIC